MNDDQLTQPQNAMDAQDSSNGDEGTRGTDITDDTGSTDGTDGTNSADAMGADGMDNIEGMGDIINEDTQSPSLDASSNDASSGSVDMEAPGQQDDSGGANMDAGDSTPVADETPSTDAAPAEMDMGTGAGVGGDADIDGDAGAGADAGAGVDASTNAGEVTDVASTAAPQPTADERSGGRQDRGASRPQYDSDEDVSDEMVIHIARDPRMDEVASNASMEDLMKASERQYRPIKHGDVIEGTVMKVGREEIMIDIGGKTEGVIASRESTTLTEEERDALQIGDTLLVSVVQPHNSEGQAVLSLDRARQEKAWRDLQKSFEAGETISAPVVGHNKGGILVNIEGIRGFVPSSQVSSLPPGEANKQAEMARLMNQSIPLKIIEINRHRNRLILSERQAMQEQRDAMRARLLLELEHGQIRPGTVTSVCDFGAFVDIGGADGLIHLSELSWKRVSHPSEVLKVGDRINVYVLSVDQHERKIALSLKRTQPEPWDTITDQYQLGQMVRGTITQITTFGAFARLEDGIEGLIHVSELAEGRVGHPSQVVKMGEQHDLKVIRIDPARKRIGLSLKRVNEDAERAAAEAAGEGGASDSGSSSGMDMGDSASMQTDAGAGTEQTSRPEPRQDTRPPRQDTRPPRQGQGQRPPRGQQQPQQPLTSQSDDFEHLGAFAAALHAHTQQADARSESDDAAQDETMPAQQEEQSDPGEVVGSISGINTSADMDATSAMEGGDAGDSSAGADTGDIATEDATDSGDTSNTADVHGETDDTEDSRDTGDTTATTPEPGAFGSDESSSMTDVATDSGDMPSEEEQGSTDSADTGQDNTDSATASNEDSGGGASGASGADSDAADTGGDEPQAMMPSASETSEDESSEAGDTGDAGDTSNASDTVDTADTSNASDTADTSSTEESPSPAFTDVVSDSGDMVGSDAEASMPSSESMDSTDDADSAGDAGDTSSAEAEPSSSEDSSSLADVSAEDVDNSATISSDDEPSSGSGDGDDQDANAPSGSEGAPSRGDSGGSSES